MDLVTGYDSESDTSEDSSNGQADVLPAAQVAVANTFSDDSEEDSDSSDDSVDSATLRTMEAEARLRDYGDMENSSKLQAPLLPSAALAFSEVAGPPSFLDPEATRPLASSIHQGEPRRAKGSHQNDRNAWHGPKNRVPPGKDFDIAKLAPALKGDNRANNKRPDVPDAAVIEGKAKKYKANEAVGGSAVCSNAQIAMLGGQVSSKQAPVKNSPSDVSEFLHKGVGGALLPRKGVDRKDKEKEKREKGQSTHAHWKSEAEMLLRQQYDS